ncbi:hypothetical protein LEP1GSC026_1495 [Leptospira interrogans str. 2002000623]|nr:hypothetical protein LEP1GSC026_1495 [Leptospira interrogans str. 2002000623]
MSSLQENLLEKTGELQAILDGITEPLVLIDPGFRIRRVNRSTLEFSSQSSFLSIIGKKCFEVLYNRNDVCPYCPMKGMQSSEENFNRYFEYPRSDVNREIFHSVKGQKETLYLVVPEKELKCRITQIKCYPRRKS